MAAPRWKRGRWRRRRRAPKISSSVRTTSPSAGSWKPVEASPTRTPSPSVLHSVASGQASSPCSDEDLAEARRLALVVDDQAHGEALDPPLLDLRREHLELAAVAAHRARAHGEAARLGAGGRQQREVQALELRQQLGQRHRGRGVVGRRLEHGGIEEHREGIAGHVGGRACGDPPALVVLALRGPHQRQHVEVEQILHRALGGGVEEAQRLDLVAEELQAHRPLARGREDVHDAAAEAPLPHLDDRLHALVARGLEPGE